MIKTGRQYNSVVVMGTIVCLTLLGITMIIAHAWGQLGLKTAGISLIAIGVLSVWLVGGTSE